MAPSRRSGKYSMNSQDTLKTLTITRIVEEVNAVKLFYLQEEQEKIVYQAGQYLTFTLAPDGTGTRRSYSLVSSPVLQEPLCIAVKRIKNGVFSRHLYDRARTGDKLVTTGAGGVFVLPGNPDNHRTLFFFAAGTGIAPVFSLIKTALVKSVNARVVLIYSNSSQTTTLFYAVLKRLEAEHPGRFFIEFIFSDTKFLSRAHLHPGLIEAFVKQYDNPVPGSGSLYYICGPEAYMRSCIFTLKRLGVSPGNIKKEIFDTSQSIARVAPPDMEPHWVTLLLDTQRYDIRVQYPLSILAAAKKQGILLPYSCEVGRCRNCIATCERGTVWMSNNEVLTESETAQGLILTCTGYPVAGNVILRY